MVPGFPPQWGEPVPEPTLPDPAFLVGVMAPDPTSVEISPPGS